MMLIPERVSTNQRFEAIRIAQKIIDLVGEMKRRFSAMPKEIVAIEADANADLCNLTELGGTEEDKRVALEYAKEGRRLFKSINEDDRVMLTEHMISNLETSFAGGIQDEEVKKFETLFKQTVKGRGESNMASISAAMGYATALKESLHGIEAERLATKYTDICCRVCGREHDTSKEVTKVLNACRVRLVILKNQDKQYATALRYESDDGALAVRGPVRDEWDTKGGTIFTLV